MPEIAATMRELSKEMLKMGIIDEMMEETMESMEPEELEEEAQVEVSVSIEIDMRLCDYLFEVDKVLWEITTGELGKAPAVPAGSLSVGPSAEAEEEGAVGGEPEEDIADMRMRLDALRS